MTYISPSTVFWLFVAGLAVVTNIHTILILPAIFAGSSGGRLRPVAIVLGMIISFTIIGMASSTLGVGISSFLALRWVSIFVIIGMGAVLFNNDINQVYLNTSNYIVNFWRKHAFHENAKLLIAREGFLGGLLLGMSIGVIWLPPVGMILGGLLGYTAQSQNLLYNAVLFLIYSLGFSTSVLVIAYLGKSAIGRVRWFDNRRLFFKKLSGLILILVGLMVLFGIYEYLIKLLLPFFPPSLDDYLLSHCSYYLSPHCRFGWLNF